MRFEKLDNGQISEVESKISKEWKKNDILQRCIDTRKDGEKWVFYDGPIYANGFPVIRYTKLIFLNFLLNQGITGYSSLIQSI